MTSSSPCTISTLAPLLASASAASSSPLSSPETARATLRAPSRAVAATPSSPPVAAESTTRAIPRSHPVTTLGRRYPSVQLRSSRMTRRIGDPTALASPSRQNAALRTILRRNRTRNGESARASAATTTRATADASAIKTPSGRVQRRFRAG